MNDDSRRVIEASHRFRAPPSPSEVDHQRLVRIEEHVKTLSGYATALAGTNPNAVVASPTVHAGAASTRPGVVPRSGVDTRGSALPVVLAASVLGGLIGWSMAGGRQ